eukprot:4067306-Ditylum_brightwellii.AAC.1
MAPQLLQRYQLEIDGTNSAHNKHVLASTSVCCKHKSISRWYPSVRPLDVGFYTVYGQCRIDVNISGTQQAALHSSQQEGQTLHMLKCKEFLKWCETA